MVAQSHGKSHAARQHHRARARFCVKKYENFSVLGSKQTYLVASVFRSLAALHDCLAPLLRRRKMRRLVHCLGFTALLCASRAGELVIKRPADGSEVRPTFDLDFELLVEDHRQFAAVGPKRPRCVRRAPLLPQICLACRSMRVPCCAIRWTSRQLTASSCS
jgi:hypothetical protein